MGPVTIAVDSFGPVTDNAQSVYRALADRVEARTSPPRSSGTSASSPTSRTPSTSLRRATAPGNTFKATAKPVLIGTAVVGATTMVFGIIMLLKRLHPDTIERLSLVHPEAIMGLLMGGAVIYWFTGASTQAVVTGAYRAVVYIKDNMKLDATTASVGRLEGGRADLHAVRPEGDDQHLHRRVLLRPLARVLRSVLLHRLPDRHRVLRALPGHLHGQRRRRLGQREEDRRGRAEAEGHAAARGDGRRRHGRRSRSRTPRRSRSTRSSSSRRSSASSPSRSPSRWTAGAQAHASAP